MSRSKRHSKKSSRTAFEGRPTDGRSGRVLAAILDASASTTEREIAETIAAAEDVDDEVRGVHVTLRHADLPRLVDAGLVEWDETDGTVSPSGRRHRDDPPVDGDSGARDGRWDDVDVAPHRRTVLAALASLGGSAGRSELAREVAHRQTTPGPSPGAVETVGAELHHVDLPKLAAAGLVEYDPRDGEVLLGDDHSLE